ncbi:CBS domain-containing protein [Methylocystis sp. IM3]|uniref:CBS domain-containing protein n=1 Tax=unclassified Methylocystis TaxID=2625913 RepID=UPI0030FB9B33
MLVESVVPLARRRLATIGPNAVLADAALALCDGLINLVIVCNPDGTMGGVITTSDIIRCLSHCQCRRHESGGGGKRLHAADMESEHRSVCACAMSVVEVMTRDVRSCRPNVLLSDVWSLMKKERLLHVPIIDEDAKPLGVLNARDALQALLSEVEEEEGLLRDYVMGIGYH